MPLQAVISILIGIIIYGLSCLFQGELGEQIFIMGQPYTRLSSLPKVIELMKFYGLACLILSAIVIYLHCFVLSKPNLNSCIKAPSKLWLGLLFLLVHGGWISNGYYFYDDMTHFSMIPELGWDIFFANNGGQPYPIYFAIMKIIWICFAGEPMVVNFAIAAQIFLSILFLQCWLNHYFPSSQLRLLFSILLIVLPHWKSFYCGGYVLMSYIHAVFFFSLALWTMTLCLRKSSTLLIAITWCSGFLGSISSTSGAWITPSLLIWFGMTPWVLGHPRHRPKAWIVPIIALVLSMIYHYYFFNFIYLSGNTIRYDYGVSFEITYLFKHFFVILSYLCSSPLIHTPFQGILPDGLAATGLQIFNLVITICFFIWISSVLKSSSHSVRLTLIYFCSLFLGLVFMITLGRYAAPLDKVIFHDKYLVMPLFFFYSILFILIHQSFKSPISLSKYWPILFLFAGIHHFSDSVWECIQFNPLRHSVESSRIRKITFDTQWKRLIQNSLDNLKTSHMPNLTRRQLYASTYLNNGPQDIISSDLRSFISYRYPRLHNRIDWIEASDVDFKQNLLNIEQLIRQSTLAKQLFCAPVFFKGHEVPSLILPDKVNEFEFDVECKPHNLAIQLEAQRKLYLDLKYQSSTNENYHEFYSKRIDIEIYGDTAFSKQTKLGTIRFSNLELSQSLPLSKDGHYRLYIDLSEQLEVALSSSSSLTSLRFSSPGNYRIKLMSQGDK